ncbi:MAG: hypothetical protein WC655_26230 [Candidatus Hydrogenedentales bacterium]|jgi:hypothetical protein
MRLTLCLVLSSLIVCGFGCSTPYKPNSFMGGFSETRLAEDVFRVNFRGNAYTSEEQTQDFAMLRTAELATENGFKFFAVINEENTADVSAYTTPGTAQTTGSTYIYGSGARNYSGSYSGQTTYTPPQTYFMFKPRSGLLVRCFKEKPEKVYVFDAAFLRDSIRSKYKID